MEDSWSYIWEKANDLRRAVFMANGTLAERFAQVRANDLMYLLGLDPLIPK